MKRRSIKLISCLLAVVMMASFVATCLVGCNKNKGNEDANNTPTEAVEVQATSVNYAKNGNYTTTISSSSISLSGLTTENVEVRYSNPYIVFSNDEGHLRTYYGTKTMFNRLMQQNGLEQYHFHFHTLRHTYATMLFEMEENPKIIQRLMGHSNVTTTIQTYNSVDRTFFKQATDKLEKQFKKN